MSRDEQWFAVTAVVGLALLAPVLAVIGGAFSAVFLWLFYPTVARAFDLPVLSFWQLVCLAIVCSVLFKGTCSTRSKS